MPAGDTYILRSISIKRVVFLLGITACRFTVACLLGFAGAKWLCNTRNLTDLVLNAAALAFVLDIDDLIYGVLTPSPVKALVQDMRPLPGRVQRSWEAVVPVLFCLALMSAFLVEVAVPMSKQMADIELELCERGFTEFIVEGSPTTGLIVVANTSEFREVSSDDVAGSWFRLYVKEILAGNYRSGSLECTSSFCSSIWLATPAEYSKVENPLTVSGYPFWRDYCSDILDSQWYKDSGYSNTRLTWLRFRYQNATASSCSDFYGHCDDTDAEVLRWLCPRTCGCHNPRSGQWYDHGCPAECFEERTRTLNDLHCENTNPAATPSDFNEMQRWLGSSSFSLPDDICEDPGRWDDWASAGMFDGNYWWDACHYMWGGKLKTFCPLSCGCTNDEWTFDFDGKCPTKCAQGNW